MLTCWLQSWCQQFQFNLKIQSAIWTPATHILAGLSEPGGPGGGHVPLVWADQVTLSQPGEMADCAHHITMCPSDFHTFLRPCLALGYKQLRRRFKV